MKNMSQKTNGTHNNHQHNKKIYIHFKKHPYIRKLQKNKNNLIKIYNRDSLSMISLSMISLSMTSLSMISLSMISLSLNIINKKMMMFSNIINPNKSKNKTSK